MSKEKVTTLNGAIVSCLDERLCALSNELDSISAMSEILALYLQNALKDSPEIDTASEGIVVDYVRGLASYSSRIACELATFDLAETLKNRTA